MTYYVNFGTGAGNYGSDSALGDLIERVNGELTYTQEPVKIEDETGNVVARLPWYGVEPSEDDEITEQFGTYGFYGAWIIEE